MLPVPPAKFMMTTPTTSPAMKPLPTRMALFWVSEPVFCGCWFAAMAHSSLIDE